MKNLVNVNRNQLLFLQNMLEKISSEDYSNSPDDSLFEYTVGQQVRHIIDHYLVFLDQIDNEIIDYYQRERNEELETDLDYALATIRDIINSLEELEIEDRTVQIQSEGREHDEDILRTTVKRECSFLATHSIHHLAILKIMAKKMEVELDEELGLAPATIEYRASLK